MPSAPVCSSRLWLCSSLGMHVQTALCRLNISLRLESWNCFLHVWETNVAPGASAPSCGANAVSWNPVTSYLFPHSPFFSTASYSCITRWGCQCWPNPALYHWPCGRHYLHAFINFTADDHEDKLGFKNVCSMANPLGNILKVYLYYSVMIYPHYSWKPWKCLIPV